MFEQILKIIEVLGSDELLKFHLTYGLKLPEEFNYNGFKKKPLSFYLQDYNQHLATETAIDLASKLLCFDPSKRITAKEALEHDFFKN